MGLELIESNQCYVYFGNANLMQGTSFFYCVLSVLFASFQSPHPMRGILTGHLCWWNDGLVIVEMLEFTQMFLSPIVSSRFLHFWIFLLLLNVSHWISSIQRPFRLIELRLRGMGVSSFWRYCIAYVLKRMKWLWIPRARVETISDHYSTTDCLIHSAMSFLLPFTMQNLLKYQRAPIGSWISSLGIQHCLCFSSFYHLAKINECFLFMSRFIVSVHLTLTWSKKS